MRILYITFQGLLYLHENGMFFFPKTHKETRNHQVYCGYIQCLCSFTKSSCFYWIIFNFFIKFAVIKPFINMCSHARTVLKINTPSTFAILIINIGTFLEIFLLIHIPNGDAATRINDVHSSRRRVKPHRKHLSRTDAKENNVGDCYTAYVHADEAGDKCRSRQAISRKVRWPEEVPSQIFHGHLNMGLPQTGTRMCGGLNAFSRLNNLYSGFLWILCVMDGASQNLQVQNLSEMKVVCSYCGCLISHKHTGTAVP